MEKLYIRSQDLLEDSFRLAAAIYASGFRPHFIVGIWRGGSPVGIAVQEYFEFRGVETDHIAIRTSSYTAIGEQSGTIRVHGLHYIIENVNAEDALLIVDDVFDSGRSIRAVLDELEGEDPAQYAFRPESRLPLVQAGEQQGRYRTGLLHT